MILRGFAIFRGGDVQTVTHPYHRRASSLKYPTLIYLSVLAPQRMAGVTVDLRHWVKWNSLSMSQEASEQQQAEKETASQAHHLWRKAKCLWSCDLTPESLCTKLALWDVVRWDKCGFPHKENYAMWDF